MSKSCVFIPKRGKKTFKELKSVLGHSLAATVFNASNNKNFQIKYNLELDEENMATLDSIIHCKAIQYYIGDDNTSKIMSRNQPHLEDNLYNMQILNKQMKEFNSANKEEICYIDHDTENNLTLKVVPKTKANEEIAFYQEKIQNLNDKLAQILDGTGITIGQLNAIEVAAGRVGETNFAHLQQTANELLNVVRVANNMEGHFAISEEVSHLLIGLFRTNPLIMRGLATLTKEENARKVLGNEYDNVAEYQGNNKEMIAEEALGKMLQQAMINEMDNTKTLPLFTRIFNFIKSVFKRINPFSMERELLNVDGDLSSFAKDVLEGKLKITNEKKAKAQRLASFNALSNHVDAQIKVLQQIRDSNYKQAALTQNLIERDEFTEKSKARQFAEEAAKIITEKVEEGETLDAIASFLDLATTDLERYYEQLQNLDDFITEDKFTILANVFSKLRQFAKPLSDLETVTTGTYLSDEDIEKQKFLAEANKSDIEDFEAPSEEDFEKENVLDTKDLNTKDKAEAIVDNSQKYKLSDDEKYYVNTKTGERFLRVTELINTDEYTATLSSKFDENSPYKVPSTNIGTGFDELVRDFFSDRFEWDATNKEYLVDGNKTLDEVYPNASKEQLTKFVHQLVNFKKQLSKQGITIIPRDVTVSGIVKVIDDTGKVHNVRVAGTLDLIGYDKEGNWHIYDMKTHHADKINKKHIIKWEKQLSLYKAFIEQQYGIKIKDTSIIPIKVSYPRPKGDGGTAIYTERNKKAEGYNGVKDNQLLVNGEEFKEAYPFKEKLITLNDRSMKFNYKALSGDKTGGLGDTKAALQESVSSARRLYKQLDNTFSNIAMQEFIKFLKPIIGDYVKVNENGTIKNVSIESVLSGETALRDVGFMEQYFVTMSDMSNPMLNIFDAIYKRAKGYARFDTIDDANEIIALGKEFERRGLSNYDFMFEKGKHRYVNHLVINGKDYSYNWQAYVEDRANFMRALNEKYGAITDLESDEAKAKAKEKSFWLKEHQLNIKDKETGEWHTIPNNKYYPSSYSKLSGIQQEFLDRWMELKSKLDLKLGPNKTTLTNTIKIRKNGIERIKDTMSGNFRTILEECKSDFLKSFDDGVNYGAGIQGFNGEEVMRLPLFYVHSKNGNDEDLSTDVISTLVAYADMANNYAQLNKIVNAMEIGRNTYLSEGRISTADSKGRIRQEKFHIGGRTIVNPLYLPTDTSRVAQALEQFFNSKLYGRTYQDLGETKGIDNNKIAATLLKLGSVVQLGFNGLANMANVMTGVNMQNIEAVAHEFFSAKDLAKADAEFTKNLMSYLGDIGQRTQKSKLALYMEYFNVKKDFDKRKKSVRFNNKTIPTRILGPSIQFLGQEAGDFWLYNRTAISILMNVETKTKEGVKSNLWNDIEIVPIDSAHPDYGNKLQIKKGTTINGKEVTKEDIINITNKINYVNDHLFGIYDNDSSIAARATIWGKFLMQYRDWIPTALVYRFQGRKYNYMKGDYAEGYYRTGASFISQIAKDIKNGEDFFTAKRKEWNRLTADQKSNIRRCISEVTQWVCIGITTGILSALLKGADKKNRNKEGYLLALAYYMARREFRETGALVPFGMPTEGISMINSPVANANIMKSIGNLSTLFNPSSYMDEIQSGDFKGHNSAYRALMKSPLTLYYRNIKNMIDPAKAAQYYDNN